jgi:gluconolactonase
MVNRRMMPRMGRLACILWLAAACASPASGTAADGGKGVGSPRSDGGASDDTGEAGAGAWTCPAGPFGDPIPSGATLTRIAAVPPSDSFNADRSADTTLEGPVWSGHVLYLSEFLGSPNPPPSRILQVTTSGDVSVVLADSGSNGLALDSSGVLYGAIHADGSISRFDLDTGSRTPIATGYQGSRFDSPNDLTIRHDGNIYFSDPSYQAPSPLPQSATRVYRIAPGTNAVTVVDATLTQPNGVTLSLDESTLYVSSTHGIYSYPVMTDGTTGSGTPFAPGLNGDGMVIDCAGNLYVAEIGTGNVDVLSSTGMQIGQLAAAGVGAVTNVAFGGSDRKTLYISAQGSAGQQGLFQVALEIPGMPY